MVDSSAVMFAEVLCATVAVVMAMILYCAAAGGLMAKASLVAPHVLHLHVLAPDLQVNRILTAVQPGEHVRREITEVTHQRDVRLCIITCIRSL